MSQFNNALKDIIENDKEYQDQIYASYYQAPTFLPGEEGLAKYAEIDELLKNVDFSAK